MPAGCETLLPNHKLCDVPAVGRCGTCGNAFCATHQARLLNSIGVIIRTYTDSCRTCEQKQEEAATSLKSAAAAEMLRQAGRRDERIAELKKLILACSQAPWQDRRKFVRLRTNHANPFRVFFGPAFVPVYAPLEPAVAIGELTWLYPPVPRGDSEEKIGVPSGITVEGSVVVMNHGHPGEEFVREPIRLVSDRGAVLERLEATAQALGLA